ncbi:982_t:CDS:2 [Ambispora gerdemannii]|uniref:982_t:CDS:1 n=1 Tax=Ambispora gerdemannii TaxID=144530 RepID=A0A9N9ATB7_9GLOM|nr:982_t:CDS:2 [Ambispora gerdemannii]
MEPIKQFALNGFKELWPGMIPLYGLILKLLLGAMQNKRPECQTIKTEELLSGTDSQKNEKTEPRISDSPSTKSSLQIRFFSLAIHLSYPFT